MNKTIIMAVLVLAAANAFAQQRHTLDFLTKETDQVTLQEKMKTLGSGDEQDKRLLMLYFESKKDYKRADSIIQVAVKQYPKGELAYIQLMNKMMAEGDVVKKEAIVAQILPNFPDADRNRIHHSLAYGYATARNIPKVIEHINLINAQSAKFGATLVVARLIVSYDLPAAESLIKAQIDQVVAAGVPAPPPKEGDTGPRGNARPSYFMFLELYTDILVKQGKYAAASKYAKDVYAESKGRKDQVTANYGLVLSKTGNHQEAVALLEKLVTEGKGSAEIRNALKESYANVNPGKDANAFLLRLENGMKGKIEAEVMKMAINEPSPNFSIRDIHGKTVSLADFKGKTIVLDFWATWCMPCIASFPAMQMAVNKYKADPDVRFLFIHTWERTENPLADAQNFLSNNKYKFDLYIDAKDSKTKANPAVTAMGARGIPAKFIIDGKGNIRFKVNGFAGGNEAAVAELSAMIEISKKTS